jgi:putative colanic acid biosynthesis UDP-glucose lipid carrier transferase
MLQGENNFLFRKQLSLLSLIKLLLDPFVAILMLVTVAAVWGEAFRGPYLVFSLIVFSLTFPGKWPSLNLKSFGNEIAMPWLTTVGILFLFGLASGYSDVFPEDLVATWALLTPVALFFAHRVMHRLVPSILEMEGSMRNAVIVGASELGQTLARELNNGSHLGITFEGFYDDRSPSRIGTITHGKILGGMDNLVERAQYGGIDIIYIALPMASQPRILKLLDDLRDTTASIYFVPDIFVSDLIQARIDHIHGIPVVAVCETPLYGINGLLKRASDLVIASIILLLIMPLMIAIAIGVKLGSPGPVLFRQRRYGLDGKEIVVCKFRSMTVCEDGPTIEQAKRTDKRITPFGSFLRRTSLDELPQFLNVLTGQMSIVGPRPHAVAHNELYRKLVKGYMIRHKVKPGITGWAQVNGLRGETETVDKMQARIQYDIDYLRNWSITFDLMIILKTVLVVARDRNAY